jgi:hypothetical protein
MSVIEMFRQLPTPGIRRNSPFDPVFREGFTVRLATHSRVVTFTQKVFRVDAVRVNYLIGNWLRRPCPSYCHCPTENFLPIIQVAKGDFAPALKCRRTLHPSRDAR